MFKLDRVTSGCEDFVASPKGGLNRIVDCEPGSFALREACKESFMSLFINAYIPSHITIC